MADWSDTSPQETTAYTLVLPALRDRDKDAAMMAESPTNPPIGYKRWNTALSKIQVWDGLAWVDLVLSLAGGGTGAIDAASARTALGLGSMAVQNNNSVTITGGTISITTLGVSGNSTLGNATLSGTLGVTGATTLSSTLGVTGNTSIAGGVLSLIHGSANRIDYANVGIGAPTFNTRSAGVKLNLYPSVTATTVDIAIGVESQAMWQSVELDTDKFYWYHGTTRTQALRYEGTTYTLPTVAVRPDADSIGSRITICDISSGNAPAVIQSGEPGVSGSAVVIANNYKASSTAASGRINTGIGAAYLRLITDGSIEFVRISSGGAASSSLSINNVGALAVPGAASLGSTLGVTGLSTLSGGISTAAITATGNIQTTGTLNVGNTQVSGTLIVTSNAQFNSLITAVGIGTDAGTDLIINASNQISRKSSSIRYKENIKDFKLDTRNFMAALVPISFDYINSSKNLRGFIAEEIHAHYPELVNLDKDNNPESIRLDGLVAYMYYTMRIMYGHLMEIDNHLFGSSSLG